MPFARPHYSRGEVRRAGEALRAVPVDLERISTALPVLTNWRAAHAYPLNTFQSTLRKKLGALGLDSKTAPVGQRLKRLPSIEAKLRRFPAMDLSRMQDIAGLRAVVPTMKKLRDIRDAYEHRSHFLHELRRLDDYVASPKDDGYRSIHLTYRYRNPIAPWYDGLHVELQLRTRLQHAWATAVETVDAFANQAIKAGNATPQWGEFFRLASAAFAIQEKSALLPSLAGTSDSEIQERLALAERELNVLVRLRGFSVAADHIQKKGKPAAYNLVVLDTKHRRLTVKPFTADNLDAATEAYAAEELRTARGEPIDAVLVAGGSIDQLRKTYPNYFLDASAFIKQLDNICKLVSARSVWGRLTAHYRANLKGQS